MSRPRQPPPAWIPQLPSTGESLATRLADAIAADVTAGRLGAGEQLPTQRVLARQLGVNVGTVNRAYAIAERAGLVSPEVGRGTFVTARPGEGIHDASLKREAAGAIELGLNYPAAGDVEDALRATLSRLTRQDLRSGLVALSPYAGRTEHRDAGARWLRQFGLSATGDDVLVCTSVQHGLAAALAALTVPGDVVLTEALTSPGVKSLAAAHQLRLVGVDGDEHGLSPEALVNAVQATGARVVYLTPTVHTATTLTMPDERRRAIASILAEHRLVAIEDDAWGFLAAGAVTALRTFAPDSVVYVTSVSKSLAPGLRIGFIVAPGSLQRAVTSCLGTMTWAAPLLAEVVAQWIDDGTAGTIMQRRVQAAAERFDLARKILGPAVGPTQFPAYHVWLPLPEPWRVDDFIAHAAIDGVSLPSSDIFVPGRAPTPHAVRVCTGTEPDLRRVEQGLRVIAKMLVSGPTGYSIPSV